MQSKLSSYRPVIIIVALSVLAAWAMDISGLSFMRGFMGTFFLLFSMFKFFDLKGFAEGFGNYDLIAKRFGFYAKLYPFIELSLGLLFFAGAHLRVTCLVTIILMAVGAAGVVQSLRSGRELQCACLGTMLNVPLGAVTVIENIGMGLMAALMLIFGIGI